MAKGDKSKKDPKKTTANKDSRKNLKSTGPEAEEARLARERDMIDTLNR